MDALFRAVRTGDIEQVKELSLKDPSLMNVADSSGKTSVIVAIESRNVSVVQWLVENGCRLSKNVFHSVPVQKSFRERSCTNVTGSDGAYLKAQIVSSGCQAYFSQCEHQSCFGQNNISSVTNSNNPSVTIGTTGVTAATAYTEATSISQPPRAFCGDKKHDKSCLCNESFTANTSKSRSQVDNSSQFYPPLLAAVHINSIEIIKIMLKSSRVFVDEAHKNITPLLQACMKGYADMVTLLIHHGADVNGCRNIDILAEDSRWYYKPLYQAVENNHHEIIEMLVNNGASYIQVVPLDTYSFHGADPTSMSHRALATLLELAVRKCSSSTVSFLIDIFQRDITDQGRYYSLLWSIKFYLPHMTELLIGRLYPNTYSMDRDECRNNYYQALRIAVRECPQGEETIPLLILKRFGSSLFMQKENLFIILHSAVLRCLPQVVEKLVALIKDPLLEFSITDYENWPDICSAALYYGNKHILSILYDNDLLELNNQVGQDNAFFEAIFCGKNGSSVYEILSWLVECGLDPCHYDHNKMQPIHAAVSHRLNSAVDALCRLGVDANARMGTDDLPTPLHLHLNLRVLQLGCDLNLDLIKVLISHGADLAVENRKGYTPVSILFWLLYTNIRQHETNQSTEPDEAVGNAILNGILRYPSASSNQASNDGSYTGSDFMSRGHQQQTTQPQNTPVDDYAEILESPVNSANSSSRNSTYAVLSELEEQSNDPSSLSTSMDSLPQGNSSPAEVTENAETFVLPKYLQLGSPWRTLIETVVDRFGVELFSMGAARLVGPEHWDQVYSNLRLAGINMGHLPTLRTLSWITIRKCLGSVRFHEKLDKLPLPEVMKLYLELL